MASLKKGLGSKGRGLEALISHSMDEWDKTEKNTYEIDINKIEPNRNQPRKYFNEESLLELVDSLKEYGVVQPIVLKKVEDYYEIIAGERRWRAAKIAGLTEIPAIIREYEKKEAFEVALIENIQRENLNPMEEANGYARLQEEFGASQEEIAKKVGKSRSAVTNALRLLQLDPRVCNFVAENKLSAGHARTLLGITDGELQFELGERVIEEELSVRNVEIIVKKMMEASVEDEEKGKKSAKTKFDTASYGDIENELKSFFATKVRLTQKKNKGKIEIEYYSDEDLDRLLGILKKTN